MKILLLKSTVVDGVRQIVDKKEGSVVEASEAAARYLFAAKKARPYTEQPKIQKETNKGKK